MQRTFMFAVFIDISDQLNNERMAANPVQQQQYKTTLTNNGNQLALEFKKKAAQWYQTLLKTFCKLRQLLQVLHSTELR